MKSFVTFFLLCTIVARSQVDTAGLEIVRLPDSTEAGAPVGNVAKKMIGPAGGSIISEDRKMELIFPPGALTSSIEISIQAITNVLPGGLGSAYDFEPSGLTFAKPVTSVFHYSDEEAELCPPDLIAFGLQDHNGKWSYKQYDHWDSVSKTLTGKINHFTGEASYSKIRLLPNKYDLRVSDTLIIRAVLTTPVCSDCELREPQFDITKRPFWMVNGLENGEGGDYGTVTPLGPQYQFLYATYVAPRWLPEKEIALVQVAMLVATPDGIKAEKKFACRIRLYDEYKVLITDTIATRVGEGTFVADSGTFVARVYANSIDVSDVRNYPPYSFEKHKSPLGHLTVTVAGYKGPVHIGVTKSNGEGFSYDQAFFIEENKPKKILIKFITQDNIAFNYTYKLGSVKVGGGVPIESVPDLVSFYLNGKPQKYPVDTGFGTPYTIYVKRTREAIMHYPTRL